MRVHGIAASIAAGNRYRRVTLHLCARAVDANVRCILISSHRTALR
jgi:hypothetical protein